MTTRLDPILTSPGWELLQSLQHRIDLRSWDAMSLVETLRKTGVQAEIASAIVTQLELRQHARTKFGDFANGMVFTRDGLEQATRMKVAAMHAQRFRSNGATYVADLGCGIGSDALAIAGLGLQVLAVDIDPDVAAAAAVNLRAFDTARVERGDVRDLDMKELISRGVDALFADPARRTGAAKGHSRITAPNQWSPPLPLVLSWQKNIERVGVKVAPGIPYEYLPSTWHTQWVSINGELVEASLWSPALAPEGPGRSALVIRDEHAHLMTDTASSTPNAPAANVPVGPLSDMIAEPDSAIIRSGCLATLASQCEAHIISEKIAYLSAEHFDDSPFYQRFTVLDVLPLKAKTIAAWCRAHDVGSVEIKKRGADIDPAALRKSLKLSGTQQVTVFMSRIGGHHRAIIATRCHTR